MRKHLRRFNTLLAGTAVILLTAGSTAVAAQDVETGSGDGDAAVQVRLGVALMELGRNDEARVEFLRALEAAPEHPLVHFHLGVLLAEEGESEAAEEHLTTAQRLSPGDAAVHYALGELLRRSDRQGEALEQFAAALEIDPGAEASLLGEAEALVDLGRVGEALTKLEAARGIVPESRPLDFALAWILAAAPDVEMRDGARALELAQKAFATRRSVGALEVVAAAQAEVGQCEAAAATQRTVVEQALAFSQPAPVIARLESSLEEYEKDPPCALPGGGEPSDRPAWPRSSP